MKKLFMFTLLLGASGLLLSACMAQGTFRERLEQRRAMQQDGGDSQMSFLQRLRDRQGGEGSGLISGGLRNNNRGSESVTIAHAKKITFEDQGIERLFYVYRPDNVAAEEKLPVLLIMHGGKGTGQQIAASIELYDYANEHGFIAVYAQSNNAEWNDGREATDTDISDVEYLEAVAGQLVANWGADASEIYAAGISSGGNMAQTLACQSKDVFAGFGVVASNMVERLANNCEIPPEGSMAFFYGTKDPLMTFDGGPSDSPLAKFAKGYGEEARYSSPETIAFWAKAKGCQTASAVKLPDIADDGTLAAQIDFSGCQTPIRAFIIAGGGHAWPGGDGASAMPMAEKLVGKSSRDVSATDELIKFFNLGQ